MKNTAYVVLAAGLIFPSLVYRASPPGEEPAAASDPAVSGLETAAGPPVRLFGATLPEALRLPEDLRSPSPEEGRIPSEKNFQQILTRREPPPRWPGGYCLASGEADAELCAAAARISHSRPCLAIGDCPALEDWKEVMGTPGLRPAPRPVVRADVRSPSVPEQD